MTTTTSDAPPTSTAFPYPWTTAEELSDEIARLFAHRTASTYRELVLIRAFDEMDGWGARGFKSCAACLPWRVGITPGTAREQVRVPERPAAPEAAATELEREQEGLGIGQRNEGGGDREDHVSAETPDGFSPV